MLIFKILRSEEWGALYVSGSCDGSLVYLRDGYILFLNVEQVRKTASKHFSSEDNLILAAVDSESLGTDLKLESSHDCSLFLPLYGKLNLVDVAWFSPLPVINDVHRFPESSRDYVGPSRKQLDVFKSFDWDYSIEMLNLVKFRENATYPIHYELTEMDLRGVDAYERYNAATIPIAMRLRAETVWWGSFESVLIGPKSETWHIAFVVKHPSTCGFLEIMTDPDYRRAIIHRQPAVANFRLIRSRSAGENRAFG